ncbi:uncharacterized protein DUF2723 [Marinilabilia salmonicolor]|jgi:hypothetical protein|uniref:Uncharacterized protein DUF2723 n=2 Tax=Marinilabilia salmonicolor TaxID=989 RepID=A0A2T0XRU8_9BACT|nr:DUF2723 domain-containing protein [Marinilabilia salmonicolor]PRZ01675.1 uncharacterized protein DUF2723 [Marinilabilia salmonicolor]RCW31615.1 uncharacterized protein DUF2723 [Marinilabilia salmonicolor]
MHKGLKYLKKKFPGLLVLGVSLFVYGKTMAPTVSFWDSGEFIASAAMLQVPHPPGAPIYLLLGRLFSILAPGPTYIALFINFLSVAASAFTVFFVFHILVLLLRMVRNQEQEPVHWVEQLAAGVGALLFAFTDSFWYSAVEAEVYALSLFFSSVTLWVFLKWYVGRGASPRWFYLGVFLLGLSMGVHLLNLLMAPVFVLLFVWKVYGAGIKTTLLGLLIGFVILGVLFFGLISFGLWPAMKLELLLVNEWGFFQHSGVLLWLIFLAGAIAFGMIISFKRYPLVHMGFTIAGLLLMGWFSYLMIPVRASANPDINMNAPDNVFSMHDYINRTQYGSRPLVVGSHAWAQAEDWKNIDKYVFDSEDSVYEKIPAGTVFSYDPDDYVFFPRMYSRQSYHQEGYEWWSGLDGEAETPRLAHQVDFFLKYQVGHSYLRYLMWNFAGRQNDDQGHGDIVSGNWASGIGFIDGQMLGSREHRHSGETYSASANYYYGLPLIFILAGLFFLLSKGPGRKKVLMILGTVFLMTGPLLVLYLNQPPYEPRERDYVYVASFMALAMFGGVGIYALLRTVLHFSKSFLTTGLSGLLLLLAGPGLLFSVNLNDHDRSERYLARDLAMSQLRSCPAGSVLFTYGDNDTYPLWYVQQVEMVRPDVKIVNIGLLHTFWYQQYLRNSQKGNGALEMTLPENFYRSNAVTFFPVSSIFSAPVEGIKVLNALGAGIDAGESGNPEERIHPQWEMTLPDGKKMELTLDQSYLSIGDLALLDVVASNVHQRPVCFTRNVEVASIGGLQNLLQPFGLNMKLGPGRLSDEEAFAELELRWTLFSDSISLLRGEPWFDNTCRQALSTSGYRETALTLARELMEAGDEERAGAVLKKSLREWPFSPMQDQDLMLQTAQLLQLTGNVDQAAGLVSNIAYVNLSDLYFFYYSGFDLQYLKQRYCRFFRDLHRLAKQLEMDRQAVELEMELQRICSF